MSVPKGYRRIRREACPVCGHKQWCLVALDGTTAICKRVESTNQHGNAGWVHTLDAVAVTTVKVWQADNPLPSENWTRIMEQLRSQMTPAVLADETKLLGVSPEALSHCGIGWHAQAKALAFPMRRYDGGICGIRIRHREGRKWAYTGSMSGLFFKPDDWHRDAAIHVCEGPTDRAALVELGFTNVVGRPSVDDGNNKVLQLARWWGCRPSIVVFRDNDQEGSQGHRATEKFLDDLATSGLFRSVRGVYPTGGHKDVRAWKVSGVTRRRVDSVIADSMEWVTARAAG